MATSPTPPPQPPHLPSAPAAAPGGPRRRFRASDLALHLDMVVIGEVCLGVGLAGYRSVLRGFLADESGNQAALLAALDRADTSLLRERGHALKGACASLGLRALQATALQIEAEAAEWSTAACHGAAASLRAQLDTAGALLQRMGFV